MSLGDVEYALINQATSVLNGWAVEYDNAPVAKSAGTKWARVWFFPSDQVPATIGVSGYNRIDGILQINLNYPVGVGDSAARSDVATVLAGFELGQNLTRNSQRVRVKSCSGTQGRNVDDLWRISITVGWYAQIAR